MAQAERRRFQKQVSGRGRTVQMVACAVAALVGMIAAISMENQENFYLLLGGMWLGLIVAVFVLGAVALRRSIRWSVEPRLVRFNPATEVLPEEVEDTLDDIHDELSANGFRTIGHYREERSKPGHVSYITFVENVLTGDRGHVRDEFAQGALATIHVSGVSFITECNDGTTVVTTNHQLLSGLPAPPQRQTFWLPGVGDSYKLYDIHRRLVEHLHLGHQRATVEEDPVALLRRLKEQETAHLVEIGHAYFDDHINQYRLTWKGTILLLWKHQWPMKGLWQRHLQRKTKRALAKLPKATVEA
jgi:hypothetical protein